MWEKTRQVIAVGFKVVGILFMLIVIAGISYAFVTNRQSAALERRTSPLKTWPAQEIHTRDGAMSVTVSTRCKQRSLDYRIALTSLSKAPDDLPLWLRLRESALVKAAAMDETASLDRVVDIPSQGLVRFPKSTSASKTIRLALLQTARAQIQKLTGYLKDPDKFTLYEFSATTAEFTSEMGNDRVVEGYEFESSASCDPERYVLATAVDLTWNEQP